jgi:hypothetical protein
MFRDNRAKWPSSTSLKTGRLNPIQFSGMLPVVKTKTTKSNKTLKTVEHRTAKGPEPERLKINGDWKSAVRTAMKKPKPAGGWPH